MDEELPTLKNFEPVLGPEKSESWWVRYVSYVLTVFFVTVIATALAFFEFSGGSIQGSQWARNWNLNRAEDFYLHDPAGYNQSITDGTTEVAAISFIGSIGFCIWYEYRVLKGKK